MMGLADVHEVARRGADGKPGSKARHLPAVGTLSQVGKAQSPGQNGDGHGKQGSWRAKLDGIIFSPTAHYQSNSLIPDAF